MSINTAVAAQETFISTQNDKYIFFVSQQQRQQYMQVHMQKRYCNFGAKQHTNLHTYGVVYFCDRSTFARVDMRVKEGQTRRARELLCISLSPFRVGTLYLCNAYTHYMLLVPYVCTVREGECVGGVQKYITSFYGYFSQRKVRNLSSLLQRTVTNRHKCTCRHKVVRINFLLSLLFSKKSFCPVVNVIGWNAEIFFKKHYVTFSL